MTIHVFANIGRHGNSPRALAAVKRNARGRSVFVGLAEVDEADTPNEHRLIEALFNGWNTIAFRTRVPVLWRAPSWKRVGTIKVQGHPGIPKVSPGRLITGGKWHHRINRGRRLAVLNTHTVAGAWNAKHEHNDEQRKNYWHELWDRLGGAVRDLTRAGYNVVVTLDANRQRPPLPVEQLHPRAKVVAHHATDYVIAIPADGYGVEARDVEEFRLGIDFHTGLRVRVRFPRRGRPTR